MTWRGILFDLDGTLTPIRSSWRHLHERLGLWTGRAEAHQRLFLEGRIDYAEFCRLDAQEWKGMSAGRLEAAAARIGYRPGIGVLMDAVRGSGLRTGIVSTGLTLLADRVKHELRIDDAQANHLEVVGGVISGRVEVAVTHGRKHEAVARFCGRFGLDPAEVIAVGDSEGDLSMFAATGYAIAFHPADEAVARGADAVVDGPGLEDLAAALPLQGLSRSGRPARPSRRPRGLSAEAR
ncbi:MAG TPA: HAD family phosphatase [Candidatus Polarisedimenticolia bacterium]|nr:HAD family phosphatase [Candidatus Polarisedimenticolia bacterium]